MFSDQHGQGAQGRPHDDHYCQHLRRVLAPLLPHVRHSTVLQELRTAKFKGKYSMLIFGYHTEIFKAGHCAHVVGKCALV